MTLVALLIRNIFYWNNFKDQRKKHFIKYFCQTVFKLGILLTQPEPPFTNYNLQTGEDLVIVIYDIYAISKKLAFAMCNQCLVGNTNWSLN